MKTIAAWGSFGLLTFLLCINASQTAFSQTYIRNTDWNDNDATVIAPGSRKNVRCIITLRNQPDPANNGKMIIVGDFSNYDNTSHPAIARLNADGSVDNTFGTTPLDFGGQSVLTVTEDPSGNLLIGGMFVKVNGNNIGGIARLDPTGKLDLGFKIGTGFGAITGTSFPEVYKILIKNDPAKDAGDYGIVVGGLFEDFNTINNIDGINASDGNPNSAGLVQLNLDGSFNRSFKVTNDQYRWRGGGVRDVVFDMNGNMVAVGEFGEVGGVTTTRVARILRNGGTLTKPAIFDPSFVPLTTKISNTTIDNVLVLPDNKIMIGGKFDSFLDFGPGGGGKPVPGVGPYLARLNVNGTLDIPSIADPDDDFAPIEFSPATTLSLFPQGVQVMKLDEKGRVLVGGRFSSPIGNFFRLQTDGTLDPDFNINAGFSGPVLDVLVRDYKSGTVIKDSKGDKVTLGEHIVVVGEFISFDNINKQQYVLELGEVIVLAAYTIELTAIKANNNEVMLRWPANANIVSYELERSVNSTQFQSIYTRSNTNGDAIISYKDQVKLSSPIVYYRIKAKASGGEILYSNVVRITIANTQASLVPLSATSLKLTFNSNTIYNNNLFIQSVATDGRLLLQKEVVVKSGSTTTVVSLPTPLTNGFLLLRDEQGNVLCKSYYIITGK